MNQNLARSKLSNSEQEVQLLSPVSSPLATRHQNYDPGRFSIQNLSEEDQLQKALEQSMSGGQIPGLFSLDGNSDYDLLEDVVVDTGSEYSGCELDPEFIRTKRNKGKLKKFIASFQAKYRHSFWSQFQVINPKKLSFMINNQCREISTSAFSSFFFLTGN